VAAHLTGAGGGVYGAGAALGGLLVELAGDGGVLGLGLDLGPSNLIWVGQALLLARFQGLPMEAHPLAMVWLGHRIWACGPRSGSRLVVLSGLCRIDLQVCPAH
jgi:hypothetical protein